MFKSIMLSSALVASFALSFEETMAQSVSSKESKSLTNSFVFPENAQNKILGVKLDDVVNNFPKAVPGLPNVAANIKSTPQAFFGNGEIQAVHTYFLNKKPEVTASQINLYITGYVKYKGFSKFEKIVVSYNTGAKRLSEMTITSQESINLTDMSFKLSVGLIERKLIIEDAQNDVKFIFPIGVGGFDEGVMNEGKVSLVTPRFKSGVIDKRAVISKRDMPRYFDGKPFIRILKGNDITTDMTAIGFHTEINDSFIRGFDSHGCMRLRVPDLYAVHDLIMDGGQRQTPITVSYAVTDKMDHPAGKRDKTYKTVQNVGTEESPFFPLDKDNLVQLVYKSKESGAPISKLVDTDADNYEDDFDYDTQRQLRDQNARRREECNAQITEGEIDKDDKKAFEECLNKGKRKSTMKDKIYRKWVHGK